MSIISSFKKALGFPNDFDDEDFDDLDALEFDDDNVITRNKKPEKTIKAETRNTAPMVEASPMAEPVKPTNTTLPGEIFDAVIELFNATQPEFVSQCLSIEKQRQYILDHIDKSLQEKLGVEVANARRQGEQQWENERLKVNADLEKLRSEYHFMKQQREEFQNAQLSATRQKRAMTDRIHDLEHQISQIESDREQLQLENRSMINKLRVISLRNSSSDPDVDAQNQRLAQENINLTDKVTQLESEIKKHVTKCEKLSIDNDSLREVKKAQSEEIARIKEEIEKFGHDVDIKAALIEAENKIQQFEQDCEQKDRRILDLTSENHKLYEDIKTAGSKILNAEKAALFAQEETKNAKSELASIQNATAEQISQLNNEIKRLTELINAKDNTTSNLDKQNTRSKRGRKQSASKAEIEKETLNIEPSSTPKPSIKISAIDELMDSTDWFTAPDPIPLKKDPEVEEDFGYKEPPARKTSRDEDKQLSLW